MSDETKPLLIKRYASRRLYNTETSDYVTLEDIARFIREGRDVQIVDLKSGDDLTRQYLLQIIAEHESKGENVLPLEVLTDLVRSYSTQATSVVPQFLAQSFELLRESQNRVIGMSPMAAVPGFEAMRQQQEAFLKALTGSWPTPGGKPQPKPESPPPADTADDLEAIKRHLAALQAQLDRMND
ncbi:polyhydroxyalkanoate synthesis repressor PhaR [Palleronia sediminis]|uniref:Polyhydroxyalkanoate synthesis repressor PhaR n=1 Tax=Palleronia sediminis TaxID=2547833 RepID=A0A4R6AJD0_9RHOB|nr:polyhydroxyalkanoate synthesis repressor PhaR [Palleronia sediminis]TDL81836.1 polyhydroxyalkanoate synthesis repressor PhaR [Palleronia sediminis]